MEKIIKSVATYKNFLKEDFKIVFTISVKEVEGDKVLATLKPYIERNLHGNKIIMPYDTIEILEKTVTKVEVAAFKDALNLPTTMDMYEAVKTVELETARVILENDQRVAINGVNLVASDFEIVTTTQQLA